MQQEMHHHRNSVQAQYHQRTGWPMQNHSVTFEDV